MQIYGRELLTVCLHSDKFGDHRHGDSGGMFLICHVISHDHMFKGLCEIIEKDPHGKPPPYHVG